MILPRFAKRLLNLEKMNASLNRNHYYVFFAIALCSLIVPLWLVEVPPLVDLPNHLARIFILKHYNENPFFQQNFQIVYEPIPNLAQDLIVVPLMNMFDIWTANRLFLTLTVVLFAFGCHLIGSQKGRSYSFAAIPASFLIYGGTFFYGYVNYVFSIAIFLVTFGLWLRWRETLDFTRFLTLVLLTLAIYLSHLSAIVFFGTAVFFVNAFDFFIGTEKRQKWTFIAAHVALFVLPAIAFLTFMNGDGNVKAIRWNSLNGKLIALFGPFRSYDFWLDLLCAALIASFCFWVKRREQAVFDKRILSAASFFLLIFLPAPNFFFTGDADVRIVLPGFVLLFLSLKLNDLRGKTLALFAILICFLVFRQAVISYRWIQISEKIAAERNLLNTISPESKIYPIFVNDENPFEEKLNRPLMHSVNFVTMENSSFAQTLFAFRGQQPLVFRDNPKFAATGNEDRLKWIQYLDGNDYVWTYNVPQTVSDELEKRARTVAENGKTRIWKLNK